MLSFEIVNEYRGIQVLCDKQGMATLIGALEKIQKAGHVHLLTPSNGGRDLVKKLHRDEKRSVRSS